MTRYGMARTLASTSCAARDDWLRQWRDLLPSTGEFTYDTIPYLGQRVTETALTSLNRYANGGPEDGAGDTTDYSISIDNLQAENPGCTTVALVIAWFGNSTDVSACQIYPSTTLHRGNVPAGFRRRGSMALLGADAAFFRIDSNPCDRIVVHLWRHAVRPSIVRCIRDLKARGLRVVFYPFILMTASGEPWRGRIVYNGSDVSSAATAAVDAFLGSAAASQFTRDATNLTVGYSGSPTDFSYRRMILHYANLCVVAGGVDLFLLGSELRGIEDRARTGMGEGRHNRQRR